MPGTRRPASNRPAAVAIGLAVLYRRRTQPIAAGILGAYAAIAVVVAAIRSVLSAA